MKRKQNLIAIIILLFTTGLFADNGIKDVDEKYFHMHEGNEHPHDLTLAMIDFEPDKITDPASQLQGSWELKLFQTTDHEMETLVSNGTFKIKFTVYSDYMQVTVILSTSNKEYLDPPVEYTISNGDIVIENGDFRAGIKGEYLVYTMLGMDEAYRYTFKKISE